MTGLASRLREHTQAMHREVERTALMAALLRGELSRDRYIVMLQNLQIIYGAIEAALTCADDISGFDFQPLYRSAAIARDLRFLHAQQTTQLTAAAREYVKRVHQLSTTEPRLLLAHAYVRYLGDLHGGQMLRRVVSRLLRQEDGAGTWFYDFGSPARVAELIKEFRKGLNSLQLSAPEERALSAEAQEGFRLHIAMFRQLEV